MERCDRVAEGEGFEPSRRLNTPYSLSRRALSAAQSSLREGPSIGTPRPTTSRPPRPPPPAPPAASDSAARRPGRGCTYLRGLGGPPGPGVRVLERIPARSPPQPG